MNTGDGRFVAQIIDPDADFLRGATVPVVTDGTGALTVDVTVAGDSESPTATVVSVEGV